VPPIFGHPYVQYSISMASDYSNAPDISKTLHFVSCYNEAVNRSQTARMLKTANAPISTTSQSAWTLQCSRSTHEAREHTQVEGVMGVGEEHTK
jgi:hypothetical protein